MIDFILELAKVTDKTVSREELYKEDEDDRGRGRPPEPSRRALCRDLSEPI